MGQVKKSRHIIHKTIEWERMLDDGFVRTYSEIVWKEALTHPTINQIMNILKLPPEWKEFLARLDDAKKIRKYSDCAERRDNPYTIRCGNSHDTR